MYIFLELIYYQKSRSIFSIIRILDYRWLICAKTWYLLLYFIAKNNPTLNLLRRNPIFTIKLSSQTSLYTLHRRDQNEQVEYTSASLSFPRISWSMPMREESTLFWVLEWIYTQVDLFWELKPCYTVLFMAFPTHVSTYGFWIFLKRFSASTHGIFTCLTFVINVGDRRALNLTTLFVLLGQDCKI